MSDTISRIIINRGAPGAAGSPGAAGAKGDRGQDGAGLAPSIKIAYVGGSSTARQNVIIPTANSPGQVTTNGSRMFMQLPQDFLICDGEWGLMSAPSVGNSFDTRWAFGALRRESSQVVSLPYPGGPVSGASNDQWHLLLMQRHTPMSGYRELNALCGGVLRLVANASTGSTNMQTLEPRVPSVMALGPQVVAGAFGAGNNRLANVSAADTAATAERIADVITGAGAFMLLDWPGAILGRVPADISWGAEVLDRLRDLRARNPRFDFIDPNDISTILSTSLADPRLLRNLVDEQLHPGRLFQELYARQVLKVLQRWMTVPLSETVLSVMSMDRLSADANSLNICNAGFLATGRSASLLDTKCSGTVWNEVSNLFSSGNAGRSWTASLVAVKGPDGLPNGMVDLVFNMTALAAGDLFRCDIGGDIGAEFKLKMLPGTTWRAGAWVALRPSAANIVREYNVGVFGALTYSGVDRNVKLAMALDNLTEKPQGPLQHAYEGPLYTDPFTVSSTASANQGTAIRFETVFDAPGTAQMRIRMPTMRRVIL